MSWYNQMAQELKKRDNKEPLGAIIGQVINVEPLTVSTLDGEVVLNKNMMYVSSTLVNSEIRKADIKIDATGASTINGKCEIKYTDVLKVNDKVLCIPADGGQKFFIVDKVV